MECTCLPLNRRLMARLLKVDEGSVHEQGCWERAAALDVGLFRQAHENVVRRDFPAITGRITLGWQAPGSAGPVGLEDLAAEYDRLEGKRVGPDESCSLCGHEYLHVDGYCGLCSEQPSGACR